MSADAGSVPLGYIVAADDFIAQTENAKEKRQRKIRTTSLSRIGTGAPVIRSTDLKLPVD